MNLDHTILTILLLTPLLGAIIVACIPERPETDPITGTPSVSKAHHIVALLVTLLTFVFTLHLPFNFAYQQITLYIGPHSIPHPPQVFTPITGFQFEQNIPWIANPAIRYHLGVDGLSMWLVVLTGILAPLGVLASWNAIRSRTRLFFTLFLLQQVAMIGIFVSLDLFLYYGFWELSLVPMALLIAVFGRTENRRRAAIKFFLYTFIPSALLLVAMIWLYARTGTFDLPALQHLAATHAISPDSGALFLASLAFLFAFGVKVPIFPLHGWLSDAIQEAPTAAAMIIAAKLGLYSILRFSFGIFPEQSRHIAPLILALGAIGIVYGALLALVQTDLKRLAAFATLSAVSFIALGIYTFTTSGIDGGAFQILNESLIGAALFILLGLLYERYGSYDIRDYGGLAARHPWMVTFFVIMALAAVGLPMLNGFVGEFLILAGGMQTFVAHHVLWTAIGTTGVIFSAAYMLWMIQRVFYGRDGLRPEEVPGWDITAREHAELWPLAVLFLVMGVFSPVWMRAIDTYSATITAPASPVSLTPVSEPQPEHNPIVIERAAAPAFVDPKLAAAAQGKPAPAVNQGAR